MARPREVGMGLDREIKHYSPAKVGRLLRHMRSVARLTQEVLGDRLGLHRASITKMESGTHTVSLADLMRAADVCGFDLHLRAIRRVK